MVRPFSSSDSSSLIPLNGHIELILGPMFSGKTTELFRRIRRYTFANRRCILIKFKGDTRFDEDLASTHDKLLKLKRQMHKALICSELFEAVDAVKGFDVVGIDEAQFFPDAVQFCEEMADAGKVVVVNALNSTFQRQPFDIVSRLLAVSEKITHLSAVCTSCSRDAAFTKRTVESQELQLIGGSEAYVAVCRSCFKESEKK